jgi:hypothetical protein
MGDNAYWRAHYAAKADRLQASSAELAAENERLQSIVKEAWRFWAATQGSFIDPSMLDRGYVTLRVRASRYHAFDALFRTSAALERKE